MTDQIDEIVFQKGVATIRQEIDARIAKFNIQNAQIETQIQGPMAPVIFVMKVGNKVEQTEFSIEEIEDSALAIDHPAALKVGHLVSHFVG